MIKSIFFVIIFSAISFAFGLCIGATDFSVTFNTVKWTDVASLLVTFSGFCLAFITYNRWLSAKKKDDSYQVAKKYIASLDKIRDQIRDFGFHYHSMCPAPGIIVESKDVTEQRIQHVNHIWHQLFLSRDELVNAKYELSFWNVSLSKEFDEKHQLLLKEMQTISVITTCLNSQLFHFHLKDSDNMQEVIREKNLFDVHSDNLENIIHERIEMGFEKIFLFK